MEQNAEASKQVEDIVGIKLNANPLGASVLCEYIRPSTCQCTQTLEIN